MSIPHTDRPIEPITGLPTTPLFLGLLSVPVVFAAFFAIEWIEGVFLQGLGSDALRYLNLARGISLSLVFAGLSVWAMEKNWTRALVRIRAAEARAREADRLRIERERLAALGTLAAGISHEVGNPLASISAIVQLMEKKGPDPRYPERLRTIRLEIERITRILRHLLEFARPPSSEKTEIRVAPLFERVLDLLSFDPRTRNTVIRRQVDPLCLSFEAARGPLEQVLLNLLWNASEAVGEKGEILISARKVDTPVGPEVLLEVRDTGPGIPAEIQTRVFDPFFTTKETGTGLGLSISRSLVDQMGGTIEIESAPGEGAIARVRLPAEAPFDGGGEEAA